MSQIKQLYSAITDYFYHQGYKVLQLHRPNRHIIGRLEKDNRLFFLKIAVNSELSKKIDNEYRSTIMLDRQLKLFPDLFVRAIVDHGSIDFNQQSLSYIITDYIDNKYLSNQTLKNNIKQTAKMAYELSKIKPFRIPFIHRVNPGKHLYESAQFFASQIDINSKKILRIIANKQDDIKIAYGHGDFSPWHLYKVDNKLFLIDAEQAGVKPKYYDVANFYLRLRQNLKSKRLANKFLKEFYLMLPNIDRVSFWHEFRPVLAERAIGHAWEVKNKTILGRHISQQSSKNLLDEIASDKAWSLLSDLN